MSGKAITAREMGKRLQLYSLCRQVAGKMDKNKSRASKVKKA